MPTTAYAAASRTSPVGSSPHWTSSTLPNANGLSASSSNGSKSEDGKWTSTCGSPSMGLMRPRLTPTIRATNHPPASPSSVATKGNETGETGVRLPAQPCLMKTVCVALVNHKAQGKTAERAIVLVDEKMSAAQLYVGMSRGRDENRAFVICCDDDPDAHVRRPASDALEVLAKVLRHDEVDRSAHDVIRRNFARFDDPSLLADLHDAARWRVDREAGPDRSAEIAALVPRANLDAARAALREAQLSAIRAEDATRLAQSRVSESER